jgi:prevent-host-death family protein
MQFSVYEAKARFSELLRLVQARGEVVITQHGRRVARIVPFEDENEETLEGRLDRLAASGLLRRAGEPASGLPKAARAGKAAGAGALARFLADRG